MSEFVKIITHARRFKSALKGMELAGLEDIRNKLDEIIHERKSALDEIEQKNAEKLAKIAKYKEMIEADGLALDDLQGEVLTGEKKRTSRPPKYEITVDGKQITWTGQGRMPRVFKERIDAGASKEDFLIR